jgi:hypothetical protein
MKTIILSTLIFLFVGLAAVHAQSPTPDPDTTSAPVKQTDPEVDGMPRDINYTGGMTKITTQDLPKAVKQTLGSSSGYQGWEKAKAYRDKAGNLYVIEMKEGDTTRLFRFDKNGKLILD